MMSDAILSMNTRTTWKYKENGFDRELFVLQLKFHVLNIQICLFNNGWSSVSLYEAHGDNGKHDTAIMTKGWQIWQEFFKLWHDNDVCVCVVCNVNSPYYNRVIILK